MWPPANRSGARHRHRHTDLVERLVCGVSARTARRLARRRAEARCGCGMSPPAGRSASRSKAPPATVVLGGVQPGRHDPGRAAATMARCGCGMWPRTGRSVPLLTGHTNFGVDRWRSARTARRWRAAALMARCGCGSGHPPADRQPAHRPTNVRRVGGVSARTARRWPAAARMARCGCGSGQPPADRNPLAGQPAAVRSVAFSPDGKIWPAAATMARCGCGRRPPAADRQPASRPHRRRLVGGVQPGRQDAGQRQRRMARCGCGMRPPAQMEANHE
jgi:hypothetical protein